MPNPDPITADLLARIDPGPVPDWPWGSWNLDGRHLTTEELARVEAATAEEWMAAEVVDHAEAVLLDTELADNAAERLRILAAQVDAHRHLDG